jgi:hypothetical protein
LKLSVMGLSGAPVMRLSSEDRTEKPRSGPAYKTGY